MDPIENRHFERKVNSDEDILFVQTVSSKIKQELHQAIVGQDHLINYLLVGLFTGSHILIEGVPGIAKTLTVNLFSRALDLEFKRIQFTPDLMPADITGTSIYNQQKQVFEFKRGPIFSQVILIDEINRAPAKTQSALFEVMQEHQVTMDGETHRMPQPFMVLATQNPIEQEGTYQLPEAQQDRFLLKVKVSYPSFDDELEIIKRYESDFKQEHTGVVKKVIGMKDIENCRNIIQRVFIKEELMAYIAKIIDRTRHTKDLFLGASPRASLALVKTAKALASIKGRNYVSPDDIQEAIFPVLNHRLILSAEKEMDAYDIQEVIQEIIETVEVPR